MLRRLVPAAAITVALLSFVPMPLVAQVRPDLLKDAVILRVPGTDKVVVRLNLVFKQAGERRLAFDLYLPPPGSAKAGAAAASGAAAGARPPLVVFANGVGDFGEIAVKDWGIYKSWGRLVAASGMAAVTYNARGDAAVEDLGDLMKHLRAQAADLKVDADNVCIWSCSANVRATLPYTLDPAHRFVRGAVFYYGQLDPKFFLPDLPIFIGRAGLDHAFTNGAIDRYAAKAMAENAPVTVANVPNGRHAFDAFDDNDASRAVVRQTVEFMKDVLSPGYQAGRLERAGQVDALALRLAKNWPAVAEAGAAWVKSEPRSGYAQQIYAEALYNLRRFPEAGAAYAQAGDMGATPALTWYNAACSYALAGDKPKALELLGRAIGTGYITDRAQVRADPDLASLRDDPQFVALVGN